MTLGAQEEQEFKKSESLSFGFQGAGAHRVLKKLQDCTKLGSTQNDQ